MAKPQLVPTQPQPRMFPVAISGTIDLDAIKEEKDLDAVVANIAGAARSLIFRELVKRDPPPLAAVPADPPPELAPDTK